MVVSGAFADEDHLLLEIDGQVVKWGEARLGTGAVVTYALANRAQSFADARNCRNIVPVDGILRASHLDRAALERELEAALAAWERVADIRFRRASDRTPADIVIGAQRDARGYAFADVAPNNAPADFALSREGMFTAGYSPGRRARRELPVAPISRSLVCLNPEREWKVGFNGDLERYDLRYTFMHEIGHAIGLDHPGGSGEMMSFRYLERFRAPQPGDVAGAVRLYGPVAGARP